MLHRVRQRVLKNCDSRVNSSVCGWMLAVVTFGTISYVPSSRAVGRKALGELENNITEME